MALPAAMFLFKITFIFFLCKRTILESMIVNDVKFGSAMIRAHSFMSVTTSQRLLLHTLSNVFPNSECKMSLKIYFSTYVFA